MDQSPLVSLAAAHPLIDIDGTVFVQFALYLVLALLANALLFQPYLKLRERRRAGIDGARDEAAQMTAQADAKLADYEKQLAQARNQANEEARKVRLAAAAHEREVTDKARADAQKAIEAAASKMRSETDAARAQLMPQAEVIARQMANKLLGREVA